MSLLLLFACPQKPLADSGTPTDDSAAPDSGDTDETGTPAATGLAGWLGVATAGPDAWSGTEEWYFVGDSGDGEDLCRIRYVLTDVAPRTDCADCAWAFDLEISGAEVIAESGVGCLAVSGYDATTVSALDGGVLSLGYSPEYFGHAEVLMVDLGDGAWNAATFAEWDEATGSLDYDREDGFFEYEEVP